MAHRLYKLLSKTALSEIGRKLDAACGIWSSAWLSGALPVPAQCRRAAEYRSDASVKKDVWMYAGADAAQWVAVSFAPSLTTRLGGSLLASGAPARVSALLNDLVMRAVTDLMRPLCPWVTERAPKKMPEGERLPAQVWEAGSGAVVATLEWDGERMEIVFSAGHVSAMLDAAKAKPSPGVPFARITDTLLNERLTLKVLAGEALLELGLLQTIAVGDVIKLNTRIDEPLQVLNDDGTRFCEAFLGSRDGRKSIQLIAQSLTEV